MSTCRKERFEELAHKVLAQKAQTSEMAELDALIAEDQELKKEFKELGDSSGAIRNLLMLMQDIEHPKAEAPPLPAERLKARLAEAFAKQSAAKGPIAELVKMLETWATAQTAPDIKRMGSDLTSRVQLWARSLSGEMGGAIPPQWGLVCRQMSWFDHETPSAYGLRDREEDLQRREQDVAAQLASVYAKEAELAERERNLAKREMELQARSERTRETESNVICFRQRQNQMLQDIQAFRVRVLEQAEGTRGLAAELLSILDAFARRAADSP